MKNIKITKSCLVGGKHAEAGTVLKNVDTRVAADLVISGRAVDVTRGQQDEPTVGHRDPVSEDRDPAAAPADKPAAKKAAKKSK